MIWSSNWFHWAKASKTANKNQKRKTTVRRKREFARVEGLEPREMLSANFPLSTSSWTALGPAPITNGQVSGTGNYPVSGRITGIAADPTDANTIYISAAGGGVWKTADAGVSWAPLTDNQTSLSMGAIAIAPTNRNYIYAGTGEANNAADSNFGVGILYSKDAGATWTLSQGPNNIFSTNRLTTAKIVVDPQNANTVYAAMGDLGNNGIFASGAGTGVYKSTDGGVTWANTTSSITTTYPFSDVVVDPSNTNNLYAAVGYLAGNAVNGIYKSTNGGTSWSKLTVNTLTGTTMGRTSLAIAPSNSQILYMSTSNISTYAVRQVARSTDGGATWTSITPGTNYMSSQGWYDQYIVVNPTNPANVFVGGASSTTAQVMETTNGTAASVTWTGIAQSSSANLLVGPHADHHAAVFDANGKLLDGNDGGIWRLDNPTVGSIKWVDINSNLNTIQFQGVSMNPNNPGIALGGSQDNGTERFTDALGWTLTDGGDGGVVYFSQQTNNKVYRVSPIGSFGATAYFRKSTDGGLTWSAVATGLPSTVADLGSTNEDPDPDAPPDPTDESDSGAERVPVPFAEAGFDASQTTNFYPPFSIDPSNDNRLILGSSDLYLTTNGATSWSNLTSGKSGWTNTNPADAVAISKTNSGNTIYAATGGTFASTSVILVSTNGGTTWSTRSLPTGNGRVNEIDVDPTNDQIAYAVVSTFTTGAGHVWRTTNGGTSWTDISGNLPNLPTWSLRIDTNNANTLYVGNDSGVYVTTNLGTSWSTLSTGLPKAQMLQLDFNATTRTLAVATHGRGMYEVLTQALTVTNVTSSTANGSYAAGSAISIQVTYSGIVNVTGSPQLALNPTGSPSAIATYASGSGTNTLTFTYTVQAGQNSVKLDEASASALTGTVKDANGNFASIAVPTPGATGSLAANKTIVIDTVAPTLVAYRALFGSKSYNLLTSTRFDLPWQITGIQAVFSETIGAGTITSLTGVTSTAFAGLGTTTLTWSINTLSLGLFNTALLSSIKDVAGNSLSQTNNSFKVLYGDFNDDGFITSADVVGINNAIAGPYNLFADLDGSGLDDTNDLVIVRKRIGIRL